MSKTEAAVTNEQRTASALPVERIRIPAELHLAESLESALKKSFLSSSLNLPRPEVVRRQLIGRSLRLTEGMAPDAFAQAMKARERLGVTEPLEIYQSSGSENAAIHLIESPILLEVQGRLLNLLDPGATLAVFGHEIGHWLAHGPWHPIGQTGRIASLLLGIDGAPEELRRLSSALSMARELTADRFGLLAARDLDAVLRLEMVSTTGLPGSALTLDTNAYLEQCRELMEACLADGEQTLGTSHPEHSVRAWASWLFSESDLYRDLTGLGPGTRPLSEVNALVERVLYRPDLDGAYSFLEEPPPEMHEFALASAVLVAWADGELVDAEAELLEASFADLVSDWRAYLDIEFARRRFSELSNVVAALGADTQRSLLMLLLHVLAADGTVDSREIAMVRHIGDALGCQALFDALLAPLVRRLVIEKSDDATAPAPLPPRRGEVEEALDAFLSGYVRRGGGTVTLRRLLRIAGARERNRQALAAIIRGLRKAGLSCEADWDTVLLDDPIELIAPTVEEAPEEEVVVDDNRPLRERLIAALTRLRDELVSGDGFSPAIRLHRPRSGRAFDLMALEAISIGRSERVLASIRNRRRSVLVSGTDIGKSDTARGLSRELLNLFRENQSRMEETGAHDLYIGHPFLTGKLDGYVFRGPLVLHPLVLRRGDKGSPGFEIVPDPDDSPVANQALIQLLFHKAKQPLPEDLVSRLDDMAADPTQGAPAILEELRRLGLESFQLTGELQPLRDRREEYDSWSTRQFEVEECAVLGLFPQSRSDLIHDYDALIADLREPGADIGKLLGAARELLPESLRARIPVPALAINKPDAPLVPLIHADPTQREVLRKARGARALVVDGPPGTGKSQVIVNLVADALARGERVAVVSEKRAAIDVVANRLESAGLRDAAALVHDVHEDRRALCDQISRRLEKRREDGGDREPAARVESLTKEIDALVDRIDSRESVLTRTPPDKPVSFGELATLAAGLDVPDVSLPEELTALRPDQIDRLMEVVTPLRESASLFARGSIWTAGDGETRRRSLAATTGSERDDILAGIEAALESARKYDDAASRSPVSPELTDTHRPALESALAVVGVPAADEEDSFSLAMDAAVREDPGLDSLATVRTDWLQHRDSIATLGHRIRIDVPPGLEAAMAVLIAAGRSLFRFFSLTWWRSRGVVRRGMVTVWPERAGEPLSLDLLRALQLRLIAAKNWRALDDAARRLGWQRLFPDKAATTTHRLARTEPLVDAARRLAPHRSSLELVDAWPGTGRPVNLESWRRVLTDRLDLSVLHQSHRETSVKVRHWFPWLDEVPAARQLESLLDAWKRDSEAVLLSDRRIAEAEAIFPKARELVEALVQWDLKQGDDEGRTEDERATRSSWRDVVLRFWALEHVRKLDDPSFDPSGEVDDRIVHRLSVVLREAADAQRDVVLAATENTPLLHVPAAARGARRTPEQRVREEILREAAKRRNVMPLRTMVRRFANSGLFDALPVWLLSPETMTVLFPREPLFDLVIFDEASQCTVENGFPVMLRARRAVIAGDEKQMPPTSFFRTAIDVEESGDDDEEDEHGIRGRNLLQSESLLTLARSRTRHAPLSWHYRCREEELIAFSNHAMYGGELLTIPSTATRKAAPAVEWVHVENAHYESGRNETEARRVVDLLHELMREPGPPTLGVITFNLQQRRTILDEIDRRRSEDPDFGALWSREESREALDDRPFVKNLENVQGDERDVILFSLGHAPVERIHRTRGAERYVPSRFGPLGRVGGERRLNVAISRARERCIVVSSFEPHMLSVARTRNDGPKLFKAFLEFAHHLGAGRRNQAERVLTIVRERALTTADTIREPVKGFVPLKGQIAAALIDRGVACDLDLGTSGFRVPLAINTRDATERYRLAVFCEEGSESLSALQRAQRLDVLRSRGWRAIHVTAREWLENREKVLERIETALKSRD